MANDAWDREVINVRERPLSSDINTAQSQLDRSLREHIMRLFRSRISPTDDRLGPIVAGCIADGLKVRQQTVPSLGITVSAGLGFANLTGEQGIGGVGGLDDLSVYKPLPLLLDANINGIPVGPGAGNTRIDIVEARMNRVLSNPLSRDALDTISGLFVSGLVNKTLSFNLDGSVGVVTTPANSTAALSYKVGIAGGAPVAPPLTPGYMKLATIKVPTSMASVTRGNIIDQRVILHEAGLMPFALSCSIPSGVPNPPTLLKFDAPAGVECVIVKDSPADHTRWSVWVIGGDVGAGGNVNIDGQVIRPAYSSGEFYHVQYQGTVFGLLTAGNVASLADATTSHPALAFAEGAPYFRSQFYAVRQAAGTTDAAIPSPMALDLQGFLQRY